MRHALLCFVLLAASTAFAEDAPKGTPLPFNPFADAKVGDWTACQGTAPWYTGMGDYLRLDVWEVRSIEEGRVTVLISSWAPEAENVLPGGGEITFEQQSGPTLEQLLRNFRHRFGNLAEVKVSEGTYSLGGKEVACKVVRAREAGDPADDDGFRLAVYLSKEIRGCGIASVGCLEATGGTDRAFTLDVIGFGTKDKVEWGKRPEPPAAQHGDKK